MAAPSRFSKTAKEAYDYVASLGLTDPQQIIAATTRFYAGKYGFQDMAALGQIINQEVMIASWESNLESKPANDPSEKSYGLFQNNIETGRGTGYTAAEMLDPITNTILAVEELLPLAIKSLAAGMDYNQMADVLVRQGQRPNAVKYPKEVANYVAYVQGAVGTAAPGERTAAAAAAGAEPTLEQLQRAAHELPPTATIEQIQTRATEIANPPAAANEEAYAGAGGGGTEDTEPWTDEEIVAFTSAGLTDSEADDAERLLRAGLLPGPSNLDAYEQYGELLKAADAAGVPVGDVWTALQATTTLTPEEQALTPDQRLARGVKPPSPGQGYKAVLDQLGLGSLEAGAKRLGLTGAQLQQAIKLGLSEDDIVAIQSQGWPLDYGAKLRDQAAQKGMSLTQAINNGYIKTIIENEYLRTIGGGDIVAGGRERERLNLGLSPEQYATYQNIITGKWQKTMSDIVAKGTGGVPGGEMDLNKLTPDERAQYQAGMKTIYSIPGPGLYGNIAGGVAAGPGIMGGHYQYHEPTRAGQAAWEEAHAREQEYLNLPAQDKAAYLAKLAVSAGAGVPAPAAMNKLTPTVPPPAPVSPTFKELVAKLGPRAVAAAYVPKKKKKTTPLGLAIAG